MPLDTSHLKNCYCKRATHVVQSDKLRRHPELVHLMANNPRPQSLPRGREVKKLASPFTLHPSLKHKAAFTLAEGATHVAHSNNTRRAAFTLAEVLITLGIIAVVAAMTMPTLIANHQKQVAVTRLKKAYTSFSQALIQSESVNGFAENWINQDMPLNEQTNTEYFNTYWKPFLKIAKVCTTQDYKCGYKSNGPWKYHNGNPWVYSHVMPMYRSSFYLADGTFVVLNFGTVDKDGNYIVSNTQNLYIDINGPKNPNTLGKDVFKFYIDLDKHRILPHGDHCKDRETLEEECADTGNYCSALIMHDGWQITDNYPW